MKTPAIDAFTRHTASQVNRPIFPERFAIGGGLSGVQKLAGAIHRARDGLVTERDSAVQFFGGDLDAMFGGEPALKRLVVARCRTRAKAAA